MSWSEKLDSYFKISEHGSTVRTEIVAGFTTFMTMAYIIFVNPAILSQTGMPFAPLVTTTVLASALATVIMGLYAKKPYALAPGMGLNAYFTYTVVIAMGYTWQVALAAVFIEGLIFIALSVTKVRTWVANSFPTNLKYSIGAGIGLFLTFIGLNNASIIRYTADKLLPNHQVVGVVISMNYLNLPSVAIALFGITITIIFLVNRIKGALLWGILSSTVAAVIWASISPWAASNLYPSGFSLPSSPVSLPASIAPIALHMDFGGLMAAGALGVIFAFLMVDFFDTLGTVTGLSAKVGDLDEKGNIPEKPLTRMLLTDALGTTFGALMGTSTVTTYIESAAGVEEGGRTGLTSVVVSLLFLTGLFITPIIALVPSAATAPALILVGLFMLSNMRNVNFEDYTEYIPAFMTLIVMPFTYNISNGIGAGIIAYVITKIASRRVREISPLMYILAVIFAIYFLWLYWLH
ncbi:permease [Aciduliprofundum sp. MAR08-339]|uniref:NCS2 family permease n=1 Tax=Aciduliprofundum sp. (strain MAR08-339) TaxID=673860 RepID=UPI0002A49A63|nr:permease [Aciduliprofundum sp. MAR08-339]